MPPPAQPPRIRAGIQRPVTVAPKRPSFPLRAPPSLFAAHPSTATATATASASASAGVNAPVAPAAPAAPAAAAATPPPEKLYFAVLYTKRSKKKRKSWLDGYIILTNDRHAQLLNDTGKAVSTERYMRPLGGLKPGNTLDVSSWEIDVQNAVSEDDYITGRLFDAPVVMVHSARVRPKQKPFVPLIPNNATGPTVASPSAPSSVNVHDATAPDAVVLLPPGAAVVNDNSPPIVLDPFLARRLRPHQIDGIRFLFYCTAGRSLRGETTAEGAILADEMGLGKSLQAIALVWTMLRQGVTGKPLAEKAIIVCPASLVGNWVNEVRKWLGDQRLRPVAIESGNSNYESKESMAAFINGSVRRLLIVSYETFRVNAKALYTARCGLIICDEGHRLKSASGNKTIHALRNIPCKRRVILTGTPVQNDLEEFFAVCDFVNPGCLGSLSSFRDVYANPILNSRDTNASDGIKRIGDARTKQLFHTTSKFVLRRNSTLLAKYLPPKTETAIFCRLQSMQVQDYEEEARLRLGDLMDRNFLKDPLNAINYLRRICCHPFLIRHFSNGEARRDKPKYDDDEDFLDLQSTPENLIVKESSKMQIASAICDVSVSRGDRVVIVSNYTTALDLLEKMLAQRPIEYCRLDGSTPVNQRGDLVRQFNQGTLGEVLLLSAKAGGVGLNLIGANRLILFDPDWNPATDVQAMARVWRDGQKKHVYVYRLLCTGTIEEKIFQRQLFKGELQNAVDDETGDAGSGHACISKDGNFRADELRDVFKYLGGLKYCETLEVLERSKEDKTKAGLLEDFRAYKDRAEEENVKDAVWCESDDVLDQALNSTVDTHGIVSYLYSKESVPNAPATPATPATPADGATHEPPAVTVAPHQPNPGSTKRKLSSVLAELTERRNVMAVKAQADTEEAPKKTARTQPTAPPSEVIDLSWDDALDGLMD